MSLRHSLPLPGVNSRLASAVIPGFYGRRKKVIKTVIVLNRASRTYIITQGGLPGFLLEQYDTLESLMYNEHHMTVRFQSELITDLRKEEIESLIEDLMKQQTFHEKLSLLKHSYPSLYVAYLVSESKSEELLALYNKQGTP